MKPVLAITVGDYNGIGPEVTLRCLSNAALRTKSLPVLVGPIGVYEYYARRLRIPLKFAAWDPATGAPLAGPAVSVLEPRIDGPVHIAPGRLSARAGSSALRSLHQAVRLIQDGWADALVTAPVSKKAIHLAGSRMPGQTELLQRLTSARTVAMMLVSDVMRIGLATIHLPLRRVAGALTRELLTMRVHVIHRALRTDWGIRNPSIAVLGLNPHAGEEGDMGHEEELVIAPAVRTLRKEGIDLQGPFSADGFFGKYRKHDWDAVVAMYHDQGLIPLKYSSFGRSVNYTAGLPLIRTSPDHGTAFDIAGQGKADPGSMASAMALALSALRHRRRAHLP
jgi:4-phospho-D-threonate 3-dehydrogenase / 4-phospho-D-erythronate 3-dehydrogenase